MVLVGLYFSKMQSDSLFDVLLHTDAHVAISQYKQGRGFWFDRLPQVGELVCFQTPQGRGFIYFKVTDVYHYPSEEPVAMTSPPRISSMVFLFPFVPQAA